MREKKEHSRKRKNIILLSSALFLLGGCSDIPTMSSNDSKSGFLVQTNLGSTQIEPNTSYEVIYIVDASAISNNQAILSDFTDIDYQQAEIGTPTIMNGTITGGNIKSDLKISVNKNSKAVIRVPVTFNGTYQANDATVDNVATLKTMTKKSKHEKESIITAKTSSLNADNFLKVKSLKSKESSVKGFTSKLSTVEIYDENQLLIGSATADNSGNYSVPIRESIKGETLTVKSIKNGVFVKDTVIAGSIDIPVVNPLFESSDLTIAGKGTPSSQVSAYDVTNNMISSIAFVKSDSIWNSSLMKAPMNGDVNYVKQTDPKTEEQSDAVYVVVGATTTPILNSMKEGNVVTGSGIKNARITIKDSKGIIIGETVVDKNGNYSVVVNRNLNELEMISAYQSDDTGVSQPASKAVDAIVIDETIVANDFRITSDEVFTLTNDEIIEIANASAKDNVTNQNVAITNINFDNLTGHKGVYTIELSTAKNTKKLINVIVGYDSEEKVVASTNETLIADDLSIRKRSVSKLTSENIIQNTNAFAWDNDSKENVGFESVDLSQVKAEIGVYPITITTKKGSTLTLNVMVDYNSDIVVGNNMEHIRSDDFKISSEKVLDVTDEELISMAKIHAWDKNSRIDFDVSLVDKSNLSAEIGIYPIMFKTENDKLITVNVLVGYNGPIYYDSVTKMSFVARDIYLTSDEVRTVSDEQLMDAIKPIIWNVNDKIVKTDLVMDKSQVVDRAGTYNIDFYYQEAPSKKFTAFAYVELEYLPQGDVVTLTNN